MSSESFTGLASWGVPGFIIFVLASTIAYLYRDSKNTNTARINDLKEYTEKAGQLFDEYRHQQDLWFEKIQIAKGKQ